MRSPYFLSFIKSIAMMQVFVVVLALGISLDLNWYYLDSLSAIKVKRILPPFSQVKMDQETAAWFLSNNSIALGEGKENHSSWREYLNYRIPENLLAANLQVLSPAVRLSESPSRKQIKNFGLPAIKQAELDTLDENYLLFRNYNIVLYCTHSAETYIPNSGKAKLEGRRGLINNVGGHMVSSLQQQGVKAEFVDRIHDYPDYNLSYTNSRETVKEVVATRTNLLALLDIHRDHIEGLTEPEVVTIRGKPSARILIVVGSDERKPHPDWRKNLDFARALSAGGERLYPGLIKEVRIRSGTYNQEFFDHALLLEFGTDLNSVEEARYAGELFSHVLVEVLKEEINQ